MKTVGELLKEARIRKHYSLDSVEEATKIRKKFLIAIESDNFTLMPSLSYTKGFVRNYSKFLGLDPEMMMAFFRRQTKEVPKSSLLPKGIAEPLNASIFSLTPARFMLLSLFLLVLIFLLYFGIQYSRIQKPPSLVIDFPKSDTVTSEKRIQISGRTDPDATVMINNISVQVHPDGKFFDQVALESKYNTVTIVATSRYGKSSVLTRNVEYRGP